MRHALAYDVHPRTRVEVLCDFSPEKLETAGRMMPGARLTDNAAEVLADPNVDLVSVASYDDGHYSQVKTALEAGKHVMVEKPLCLYFDQAAEIREMLARRPGVRLSSNLVLRTAPRFIRLKKEIDSGSFGRLYHIEADYLWGRLFKLTSGWRKDMEFYSIIYGAAVHMIDLVLWLTGRRPVEVVGYGSNLATRDSGFRYNDFAVALLRFEDGLTAKIGAHGGCVHPHFHRLEIFGTSRTFLSNQRRTWLIDEADEKAQWLEVGEDYPAKDRRALAVTSFVESILDADRSPLVGAEDVFDAMSVCFAAEKAVTEGGPVTIEYL